LGASVVTKPTIEPVSLAEARAHLRIDTSDNDAALSGYIFAARMWCESYTRRAFMRQTWNLTIDHDWPDCIDLPLQPVSSVSSISYVDSNGDTQTLAADQYTLTGTGADNFARIVPAYDVTWPDLQCVPDAITVQFVAGYGTFTSDVPDPLRMAILLHVEILNDRNPASVGLLESARNALLDPYRVVRV
jgi:uncharacterized phiE125 gp8 family phage protein